MTKEEKQYAKYFPAVEWTHEQISYNDFLIKVTQYGIEQMEYQLNIVGEKVYNHGIRAYQYCRYKSYIAIMNTYKRALKRFNGYSKQRDKNGAGLGMVVMSDNYQKNLRFVIECLSIALNIERHNGFISEKAKRLTKEILDHPSHTTYVG